ncbi:MAG: hypothetical protein HYV09_02610 [Deltaproteobacteria bacterium]|nr:hypothetical protein [Deltaproteobacteria bacterium]
MTAPQRLESDAGALARAMHDEYVRWAKYTESLEPSVPQESTRPRRTGSE